MKNNLNLNNTKNICDRINYYQQAINNFVQCTKCLLTQFSHKAIDQFYD